MVLGSGKKQHLQTCVEKALKMADSASLDSVSIPVVGSGGLGLSPEDSAEVVFEEIVAFANKPSQFESCGLWLFQIWCIREPLGLNVQKQNAPLSYILWRQWRGSRYSLRRRSSGGPGRWALLMLLSPKSYRSWAHRLLWRCDRSHERLSHPSMQRSTHYKTRGY